MKKKNEQKLHLGKVTIGNLNKEVLDRELQGAVKGGSNSTVTESPVFC